MKLPHLALIVVTVVISVFVFLPEHHSMPSGFVAAATTSSQPGGRKGLMWEKLSMVNKVVEGLATEDFDLVQEGGRELAALTESAAWVSGRDPYYQHYSSNFEQAVRGLIEAAETKSPEKVTFAYVHVTFSCTACHQHVRNVTRLAD